MCAHCNHSNNNDNFMSGLFIGAVLGGMAGVLFAPEKGKETRDRLKKTLDENAPEASTAISDIAAHISEAHTKAAPIIEDVRQKLGPLIEDLVTYSKPLEEKAESYIKDARAVATDITDTLSESFDEAKTEVDKNKKKFFKGIKKQ